MLKIILYGAIFYFSRLRMGFKVTKTYIVEFTAPPSNKIFCPIIKPACCEHKKAQAAPNS
jgi:hypothetical protein